MDCIPEIRHKICSSKILLDITENKLKKVSIEALVKKYEMTAEEAIEECSSLEMSKFIDSKGKPTIFDNSKIDLGLFKRNLKNDYDDYTNILEKLSSPQTRCGLYVMELSVLSREDFLSIDDIQRLVDVDNNLAEYIMNILVSNGFVNQNGKVLLENSTAYQNTNTEQEKKDSDELTISEISALEALEEKLEKEILESSDDRDSSLETYIDDDAKVIIQQLDKVSLSKIGQYVNLAYKKQAKSIIDVVDGAVKPIISGGIIQDTNGDEPVLICVYFCNIKNNDEQRIQFELTYALKDIYYENGVLRVDRLANLKCSRTNTNSLFSELKNRLDDLSRGIISLLKTNIC